MGAFVERLARELELEPASAAALAAGFLRATREDVQKLRAAVLAGDARLVAALAHHVKGAAANLEVEPIRSRSEALEGQARTGDLARAGELLSGIGAELQRLETEP
jgi:HPt (histidine-containing phosphotransfer) domain-containing protein